MTRKITIEISIAQPTDSYSSTTLHSERFSTDLPVDSDKVGRAVARRVASAVAEVEDFNPTVPTVDNVVEIHRD